MHKDISKPVGFRRDDAHRSGLPKYHIGTSSKLGPEAIEWKDMRVKDETEIMGRTRGAVIAVLKRNQVD